MEFYEQPIDAVIKLFNSNAEHGLDENAIQSARQKFGDNVLKPTNSRGFFKILLS